MRIIPACAPRFAVAATLVFSGGSSFFSTSAAWADPPAALEPPQVELTPVSDSRQPISNQSARLWTDAPGQRQVSAVLVAANSVTVELRKENGQSVVVPLAGLCVGDQQFIRDQLTRPSEAIPHEVRKIVVPGLEAPTTDAKRATPVPGNMAYLRVSRDLLAKHCGREVRYRTDIVDNILGTSIRGIGDVEGRSDLVIFNDGQGLRGELRLTGQMHSRTTGYNGPVQIGSRSVTHFKSAKAIVLDENGLRVGPAVTSATTHSTTTGIGTNLGRLGDRIARDRASAEIAAKRAAADRIAADHASQKINRRFDADVAQRIENLKSLPVENVAVPKEHPLTPQSFRCKTSGDFVYIAVLGACAADNPMVAPPRWSEQPAGMELYLHAAVIERAMADRELQQSLKPLLGQLASTMTSEIRAVGASQVADESWESTWSDDHQWLTLRWRGETLPTFDRQAKLRSQKVR